MKSITNRLLYYNVAVIISIHLLSFTVLYFVYCNGLRNNFDFAMLQKLELIFQSKEFQEILTQEVKHDQRKKLEEEINHSFYLEPFQSHPFGVTYLQVWNDRAETVFRSSSLTFPEPLCSQENFPPVGHPQFRTIELPNGKQASLIIVSVSSADRRFVGLFQPESANPGGGQLTKHLTFGIARKTGPLHKSYRFLRNILFVISLVSISLLLLGIWFVSKAGIYPVRLLGSKIQNLSDNDLSERIEIVVPSELEIIKKTLNGYLQKVESAFQRERDFSNDVAHELKTPLAAIKTKLEFALRKPRDSKQYTEQFIEIQSVCEHLESVVSRMLQLARLERADFEKEFVDVDIANLLKTTWNQITKGTDTKTVHWQLEESLFVRSEPILLSLLFQNLLQNACHYVDEKGTIEISCQKDLSFLTATIKNTAVDFDPNNLPYIFSRFWRQNSERSLGKNEKSQPCIGLGLTIAERVVKSMSGTISADYREKQFSITTKIPLNS